MRMIFWGLIISGILWFILSVFGWWPLMGMIIICGIGEFYKFITEG